MPVSVARLRRWFVGALVLVCLIVAGTYFYVRHRVQNALSQVPGKIGINIEQSAQGFTISKSVEGRTLFKLQASKAVQFKQGGQAELHNVTITLYGRDSSRYDQVYGEAFDYDPKSGDVRSKGEVSIDLQANPKGILHPDQTTPQELKNPIHLKTRDLVFNKDTGDAWTASTIEFRVPQASGSAVGARYVEKSASLTLQSQIKIEVNGKTPTTIVAEHALMQKAPHEIVLVHARAESADRHSQADELTLLLNDDNTLEHATATGNVKMQVAGGRGVADTRSRSTTATSTWSEVTAQKLDVSMKPENEIKDAVLSGNVQFESKGAQLMRGAAARADLGFGAENSLKRVHAEGGVQLVQLAQPAKESEVRGRPRRNGGTAQDVQITSPAMDFTVDGEKLKSAETVGPPEIVLSEAGSNARPTGTRVTADKFTATFNTSGQLSKVHGAANSRVVSPAPLVKGVAQPDRITTSDSIDAFFRPGRGIESMVQQGNFVYRSGTQQAFADTARYTSSDQMVTLSGSPRLIDAGMETTARTIQLNRATGEGFGQGDVKTSYSDLKVEPNGALLASSDPVHVTAQNVTAHSNPATATYTGSVRLWQNANVIQAPVIQFEKGQRIVVADGKGDEKVSMVLVGTDQKGNPTPVTVTSSHLVYRDPERKAHFDGDVMVRGTDLTITAKQMDVYLAQGTKNLEARSPSPVQSAPVPPSQAGGAVPAGEAPAPHAVAASQSAFSPAHLDKIVATGSVVVTEPNRHATGEKLTYTAADEKFVLTGGPPSIFDAEHGKITAVSLTLFRRDGRVVVEGDSKSPAVTETQVVR